MDQVRRRKRLFYNSPVKQIKLHNKLSFMEALNEVLNGNNVSSCIGKVYSKECLQPRKITEHFIISNTGTTEVERKGKWKVV